jgi:hypothetical protein
MFTFSFQSMLNINPFGWYNTVEWHANQPFLDCNRITCVIIYIVLYVWKQTNCHDDILSPTPEASCFGYLLYSGVGEVAGQLGEKSFPCFRIQSYRNNTRFWTRYLSTSIDHTYLISYLQNIHLLLDLSLPPPSGQFFESLPGKNSVCITYRPILIYYSTRRLAILTDVFRSLLSPSRRMLG